MVDTTLNDEEKIQLLKQWGKKYGTLVSVGVIIALMAIVGWQYWQRHSQTVNAQASGLYEAMVAGVAEHQSDVVAANAATLKKDYKGTVYAQLAALFLAQQAVMQGKFDQAIPQLQWVIDNSSQSLVVDLARIRLARVLLDEGKAQDALTALGNASQLYPGNYFMIKGEVLTKLQRYAEARDAFKQALTALPQNSPMQAYIQMLMNDLPESQ